MARTSTSTESEAVEPAPSGQAAESHSPAHGARAKSAPPHKAAAARKSSVPAKARSAEKTAAPHAARSAKPPARPEHQPVRRSSPLQRGGTAPKGPLAKAGPARDRALSEPAPTSGYAGDEAFLSAQRKALLAEQATYLEQAQSLRAEAESLVTEAEPGDVQFDEESGEGGTTTVDRERDLALSAQALAAVEEISRALEKIQQGRYGICEGCGELIPKARLEALPYARLCIACKSGGLSRR